MKISVNAEINEDNRYDMSTGYSHALFKIVNTMRDLGVEVSGNDVSAPIKLSFVNPPGHVKENNQYIIGYSSHESSKLPDSWIEPFSKVDEIWSPSNFGLDVFKQYYGKKATTVFPHGVSEKYTPIHRQHSEKRMFTFLHVGEPAQRKMGNLVAEAFKIAFNERKDVKLIFKTHGSEIKDIPKHRIKYSAPNIKIISEFMTIDRYINLLHNTNCLVFPSIGEGFGMINLEALATGMPIISTWEWAEYKDFIINRVESSVGPAPDHILSHWWEGQLVGDVFLPKLDSVVENMLNVYENYKIQSDIHYENAFKIHEEYSWENVVKKYAIPRLEEIYKGIS